MKLSRPLGLLLSIPLRGRLFGQAQGGGGADPSPWSLDFSNDGSFLVMPEWSTGSGDFIISFTFVYKSASLEVLMGRTGDGNQFLATTTIGEIWFYPMSKANFSMVDGETYDLTITRVGTLIDIDVSGTTLTRGGAQDFRYNRIGGYNALANDYTGILSGTLRLEHDSLPTRNYDFDVSGAAKTGSGQPILIDTTSGLNAVGEGFNTDDSDWIEILPQPLMFLPSTSNNPNNAFVDGDNNPSTDLAATAFKGNQSFSGKIYIETVDLADGASLVGLIQNDFDLAPYSASLPPVLSQGTFQDFFVAAVKTDGNANIYYGYHQDFFNAGSPLPDGSVIGLALDTDSGELWLSVDGVWLSGDPSTGDSPSRNVMKTGDWTIFAMLMDVDDVVNIRLREADMTYPIPTDFRAPDETGEPMGVFALAFDGSDDILTFTPWVATGDFTISGKSTFSKLSMTLAGSDGDSYFYHLSNGNFSLVIGTFAVTVAHVFADDEELNILLTRVGSLFTIDVNGYTNTGNSSADITFNLFGKYPLTGGFEYAGQLSGIWSFEADGLPTRTYDFDVSGNAKTGSGQPIVIDTTSGLNATGVSMNTDDSDWIEITP